MIRVPLTQGFVALIDDEDEDLVSQYRWSIRRNRRQIYAQANVMRDGRRTTMQMHRLIMGFPPHQVDHLNRDGLDNRRANLRIVNNSLNAQNRLGYGRSRFKGVVYRRRTGKWQARINNNGRRISLGHFLTEVEAGLAYDEAARRIYGPEARLNLPPEGFWLPDGSCYDTCR